MQARATPSAPLLFFLQEQRPPESSPVAGDGERAPSSRYTRSHLRRRLLPLLTSSPAPRPLLRAAPPLILPLPCRREEPAGEERRRPDTLQLWQERERRQQQQSGVWGSPRKDRCGRGSSCPGGEAS